MDKDCDAVSLAFIDAVDGVIIGPFIYGLTERRGKWSVTFTNSFVSEHTLSTKLDFAPASWLEPIERGWVPMSIHAQYVMPLPEIKTVRLEENIAEKIARLNRTSTARDMYDLAWVLSTPAVVRRLDFNLIRRLAVLKIWVDTNGMHAGTMVWSPGHEGPTFEPKRWLRKRSKDELDLEDIGVLVVPTPPVQGLCDTVRRGFSFLEKLTQDELILARSDERDRSLAIHLLKNLPDGKLKNTRLY